MNCWPWCNLTGAFLHRKFHRQWSRRFHDALAVRAGARPRYFTPDAVPAGADWGALADWSRALATAARQQDHPWNAGLLLESLLSQARQALRPARSRGAAVPSRPRAASGAR